ncbi:MAG: Ig-like domain-containing protein [Gemmatimonadota bacterium]|nr:MAG: Ig-like domain-containing protein [Gemmatimonadota bacterium]
MQLELDLIFPPEVDLGYGFYMTAGDSAQFDAVVRDMSTGRTVSQTVVWTSSNTQVAEVDQTGLVVALGAGFTDIEASIPQATYGFPLDVLEPVARIELTPAGPEVLRGGEMVLSAVAKGASGKPLSGFYGPIVLPMSWSSSDSSVAIVDTAGAWPDDPGQAATNVSAVQLGSATITASLDGVSGSTEVTVAVVRFEAVTAGGEHSCALTADGTAYCWGSNSSYQSGDSVTVRYGQEHMPRRVATAARFVSLSAGAFHTCGVTTDGSVYCWGNNAQGQVGQGPGMIPVTPSKVEVAGLKFGSISAGEGHTCAIGIDNKAYCWGSNGLGQLGSTVSGICTLPGYKGSGGTEIPCSHVPVPVSGDLEFASVSAGRGHTCGITLQDLAYCWGDNISGQLGDGSTSDSSTAPVRVAGVPALASISASRFHTCAVALDGTGYCWGANNYGELGYGTLDESRVPLVVSGGHAWLSMHAPAGGSYGHTCGVTDQNVAFCWGSNSWGQSGIADVLYLQVPTTVAGGTQFRLLSTGAEHTCGISIEGLAYCWGRSDDGRLGIAPAQVDGPVLVMGQPDLP